MLNLPLVKHALIAAALLFITIYRESRLRG